MRRDRLTTATVALGLLLGIGYIAAGLIGWIADVTDGDGSDLAFWLTFLVGGGVLVLLGTWGREAWRWGAVALLTIGALAGAVALIWSIIAPLLAVVLIALAIVSVRRHGGRRVTA